MNKIKQNNMNRIVTAKHNSNYYGIGVKVQCIQL